VTRIWLYSLQSSTSPLFPPLEKEALERGNQVNRCLDLHYSLLVLPLHKIPPKKEPLKRHEEDLKYSVCILYYFLE